MVPRPNTTFLVYDPSVPVHVQRDKWSCTLHATEWALRSLGVTTTVKFMADQLTAEGLYDQEDWKAFHDKTLRPLADYLIRAFGFLGVHATAHVGMEWDHALREAGQWPIVAFGLTWFHSTAIKGWAADRGLVLANAADPIQKVSRQTITEGEWTALGPWNTVIIRRY